MKPKCLKKNDKIAIVSIASGLLGESFVKHELDLAIKRFKELGLEPVFMENSLKGMEYLLAHPEARAKDLKDAFMDSSISAIFCAIGGDESYRIIPYLMNDKEFCKAVTTNPKIFIGFSDITIDHFMLNKLGLNTFYGLSVITDFAEMEKDILPYTKKSIDLLFTNPKTYDIVPSDVWYKERTSFGEEQLNVPREAIKETRGFDIINDGKATGTLFGGCLESIAAMLGIYEDSWYVDKSLAFDQQNVVKKYCLLPSVSSWEGKLFFFETAEVQAAPEMIYQILYRLKKQGVFDMVCGVIIGKPLDEKYYEEYKAVYKQFFADYKIPVIYNVNFGHAYPKAIIPFGVKASIDTKKKQIRILEKMFEDK